MPVYKWTRVIFIYVLSCSRGESALDLANKMSVYVMRYGERWDQIFSAISPIIIIMGNARNKISQSSIICALYVIFMKVLLVLVL